MAAIQRMPNIFTQFACLPGSGFVQGFALATSTAERCSIPPGAAFCRFAVSEPFCVKFGDSTVTAAMPTDITDGTASEMNPELREIPDGAKFVSVISSATAPVGTVTFYLPPP